MLLAVGCSLDDKHVFGCGMGFMSSWLNAPSTPSSRQVLWALGKTRKSSSNSDDV
jgi:hypothetical protein